MKKQTKLILAVFFALLAAVLLFEFLPGGQSIEGIRIEGWLAEGAEVSRSEEEGPIDKIEVSLGENSMTMTRGEKGKWFLDKPEGARADKWKVRSVIDLFRKPIESVYSAEVSEDELKMFGLSPEKRIALKLYKKGVEFVSLFIGKSEKSGEQTGQEGDTFLMKEGDKRVYRIAGKNLTRPFEQGLKDFRDKKVFDFEGDDIKKLTLKFPASDGGDEIVIEGKIKEKTGQKEEDKDKNKDKKEREWFFVKPNVGYKPGDINSLASSFSGLYAQEYLEKPGEGESFDEGGFRIAAELDDGRSYALVIGFTGENHCLARVEGTQEFLKISKYSAASLQKKFHDLRDKKIFGFIKREEITGIEINNKEGMIVFERKGDSWQILKPAGLIPGETQINSLLSDITNLRCESYLDKKILNGNPGFNAPDAVTVSVRYGQRKAVLKIGREKDSSSRFATIEGTGEFFSIATYNYNKFTKKPEDYRNKKIFGFKADDILRIELAHPDETVEIERIEGDKKWKMTKPSENMNLKIEVVDSIASTIANLQVKDFVNGKRPEEVKLTKDCFEARVTTKSGDKHSLFISTEKKESNNYARTTEPAFSKEIFTINTYQAKNIMKHAGEIIIDSNLMTPK